MKRKRKHVGQWMDVDGEPVHVLADPAMSDATRDALAELVRHTRNLLDGGWTPEDEPTAQQPSEEG